MDPATLGAMSAAAAVMGGLFLWVVTMVVESAINKAINGFKTRVALVEAEQIRSRMETEHNLSRLQSEHKELETYCHTVMHDRMNAFMETQSEAYRFGIEVGQAKAAKDRREP